MKKLSKKIVAVLVAVAVMAVSAVSVFAAESSTPISADTDGYTVTEISAVTQTWNAENETLIEGINNGTKTVSDIPGVNVAGYTAITGVVDAHAIGNASTTNVTLTFVIPGMTSAEIICLHLDATTNTWEELSPLSVSLADKTATFTFGNLSPVIFLQKTSGSQGGNGGNTVPQTGAQSTSYIWVIAAGVLAVSAIIVYSRKKKAE